MKYTISKNLKITILSILIILVSISSFFLFRELSQSIHTEEVDSSYNYTFNSQIDYQVNLRPNNIYGSDSLDEGKTYIAELVDSIDTNFTYEFSSDQELDGSYNIWATVEGNFGHREDIETIWEKEFPIISNRSVKTTNGQVLISEDVSIDLDEYNVFVREASDSTGVNFDANLIVEMNIDLDGINSTRSNIVIPLDESLFEITRNTVEYPGLIEVIEEDSTVNSARVFIYGLLIGFGILGLIFIIFFTKTEKDLYSKELDRIFRKHGDRLVALNSNMYIGDKIEVRSMEDLVRLADELNRPILYKYSKDHIEIDKFFITKGNEIYVFDLEDYIKGESNGSLGQISTN